MESIRNLVKIVKEKIQHPGFQRYFKNTGWAFAGKVFALAMSFFVGAMVARYLGPERYGVLNYVLSFVTIMAFLASFGIDNIIPRDIMKHPEEKEDIINTAFSLKLIGGLVVVILTSIFSIFVVKSDNYTNILIFIYSLQMIFLSTSVVESYFVTQVKNRYIFIGQFISTILVSTLKLFLIYTSMGTGWFIASLLFEGLVYALVLLLIFRKNGHVLKLKMRLNLAKEMLLDSWPFILNSAFAIIYTRIDQVMIGKMLTGHSLGIYAAGVKPSEVWYFIPGLICTSIFPAIMNAKIADEKIYKDRVKKLLYFIIVLSAAVALFEFIFAKSIVLFLFGVAYMEAVNIVRIYTWAGVAVSALIIIQQYLIIENKTVIIMVSSLVGAAANVILNMIWIPKYGIIGSAYATLLSYTIIPIVIWILLRFKNIRAKNISAEISKNT